MKKQLTLILALSLILCGCSQTETQTQTVETQPATTTTEQNFFETPEFETEHFDTYDELIATYKEKHPNSYVHPLPEVFNTWTLNSASLIDNAYTVICTDPTNNAKLTLQVCFNSTHNNMEEYYDGIGFFMDTEIVETHDDYAIEYYAETDNHAICGITGERNIFYYLSLSTDDDTVDRVALIKEYKELLNL